MKPPDCIPARSTTAKRKPAADHRRKDRGRGAGSCDRPDKLVARAARSARSRRGGARADRLNPRLRKPASACSIWRNFSGLTTYDAESSRQGTEQPACPRTEAARSRARRRTSALLRPASASGRSTWWSAGRAGARPIGSGCVIGVLAVRHRVQPLACDDFVGDRVNSSSLQWKHRSGPLAT